MRTLALEPSVELPVDTIRVRRQSTYAWGGTWRYANPHTKAIRETTSLWGTIRVLGVPRWAERRRANFVPGPERGAPRGTRSV